MREKYNIILNITSSCNYDCSYCDVIKDNKKISKKNLEQIIIFVKNNYQNIESFKFFGGEPLLYFDDIVYIIDNTKQYLKNKYEIVTNASVLNDKIGIYFQKYFSNIFFSIDTENNFDYKKIIDFIKKYQLEQKLYFNLMILPKNEELSYIQFEKLYNLGVKKYNILPIYYTKIWNKNNLEDLSTIIKRIIDEYFFNNKIELFGFQKEKNKDSTLSYDALFIDTDMNLYYSDFVSTNIGSKLKQELFIGSIKDIDINNIKNLEKKKKLLNKYQEKLEMRIKGQKQLVDIMNYFSYYIRQTSCSGEPMCSP